MLQDSGLPPEWRSFGAILIGTLGIMLAGHLILRLLARRYPTRHGEKLLIRLLRWPLSAFLLLIGLRVIKHTLVPEALLPQVEHVLLLAQIAVIGWLLVAIITVIKELVLCRYSIEQADNYRARHIHTQLRVIHRILIFFVIILTIAGMLMTFEAIEGIGTSLLASAGVTGIIIGFAAQKTIGAVFAGIQIALTQPINIEDAVVVEEEWGWIEEITLTYVVIRIWDQRRLIVPITYFVEKPFQNWTRRNAEILGTVIIFTDYRVPLEEMRAELKRLAESTPLWNGRVQGLQMIDCTEKTVQIRCLVTGKDSPTTWDLRCYIREGMIAWLREHYPKSLPHTRILLDDRTEILHRLNGKDAKL